MQDKSLLLLIFIFLPAGSFSPPQIVSDSIIQVRDYKIFTCIQFDDVIGDFIELSEGEDISLSCTHPQGDGFVNMSKHMSF